MNDSGRNLNTRSSSRKFRNIKNNCTRQIQRHDSTKKGRNPQTKPQGRAGGSTPKGEIRKHYQKVKGVNRKGSIKEKQIDVDTISPNPRLDDEGLLVGTPQINESTIGSRRQSGPHQCSAEMKVKL